MSVVGTFKGTYHLKFLRIEMRECVPVPWFMFRLDVDDPVTYVLPDRWLRCAATFETDMGSVPPDLQGMVGPLDSPRGYVFHDSAFDNHGWWESMDYGQTWGFVLKTEAQVNDMLFDMCEADGVSWLEREKIYCGVEIGGSALWNGHKGPFPVDPSPIMIGTVP